MPTWREQASPIIAEIIQTLGTSDMKALRKALREAYPFGVRQYHPYRIWCDEIKRQLSPHSSAPRRGRKKKVKPDDPNQRKMF